jgi:predicted nuclease with TOPRIM domain
MDTGRITLDIKRRRARRQQKPVKEIDEQMKKITAEEKELNDEMWKAWDEVDDKLDDLEELVGSGDPAVANGREWVEKFQKNHPFRV